MEIVKAANLALRFLLELCILAALGYWGFQTGTSTIMKIALGIGAPLVAAIFWGTFLSPKAAVALSEPVRLVLEVLVFGAAAAALYVTGHPTFSTALIVIAVINRLLMFVWGR